MKYLSVKYQKIALYYKENDQGFWIKIYDSKASKRRYFDIG